MLQGFLRGVLYVAGVALVIILIGNGFHTVPHGFVGVVKVNVGDKPVLDQPLEPGWYWRRPFVVEVELFPTTMQDIAFDLAVLDRDRRPFTLKGHLSIGCDKSQVVSLFSRFEHYHTVETAIRNRLEETGKAQAASMTRDQAFDRRADLAKALSETLSVRLPSGVRIDKFLLTDVVYPEDYQRSIEALPVRLTHETYAISGHSSERRSVTVTCAVIYRIEPSRLVEVVNTLGPQYKETLLGPVVRATAATLLARSKADDVFSPEGRELFARQLFEGLDAQLKAHGIQVGKVTVERVVFDPALMDEIQNRERQKLLLLRAELNLSLAQKEVQVTRFENEERRAERLKTAESEAKARQIEAQSLKDAAILKAEGDRESLSRMAGVIEKNPRLLEYLSISRLSDKVKIIVAPPGAQGLGSIFPHEVTTR